MFNPSMPAMAGFILGLAAMMTMPASADALKDEIAPTGKLRVAIAISPAGGAFWSTKTESGGYAGVPVDQNAPPAGLIAIATRSLPVGAISSFRSAAPAGVVIMTANPRMKPAIPGKD